MNTKRHLNLKNLAFLLLPVLFLITGCKKDAPTVVQLNPLCFTAEEASVTVGMKLWEYTPLDTLPNMEYSFDKVNWETFAVGSTMITLESIGDKVYFRGDNPQGLNPNYESTGKCVLFETNGKKVAASGNVMSIIDSTCSLKTVPKHCFIALFANTNITTAPELPATILASSCYESMFFNCKNLTIAPELPANNLADYCYAEMFSGCECLMTAPELSATVLAVSCYESMFEGCRSLTTTPSLPATVLVTSCYKNMFKDCSRITSASELPATILTDYCYYGMFDNCEKLTTAPDLPAITLADYCYWGMFHSCKSIIETPELPATTMAGNCYSFMFAGCDFITTAPELPATILANDCYFGMFRYCSRLNNIKVHFAEWSDATNHFLEYVSPNGTFYCPILLPQEFGASRIPEGWTVETF